MSSRFSGTSIARVCRLEKFWRMNLPNKGPRVSGVHHSLSTGLSHSSMSSYANNSLLMSPLMFLGRLFKKYIEVPALSSRTSGLWDNMGKKASLGEMICWRYIISRMAWAVGRIFSTWALTAFETRCSCVATRILNVGTA